VSPRAVPRRAQFFWLAPREYEPPTAANRRNWLVGKQSTISNRNTSGPVSIFAELSSCLCVFYHLDSLSRTPQQDVHLDRLLCARQIRSVELPLLRSSCDTGTVGSISKPFSGNDLSRSIRSTSLTRGCSERENKCAQRNVQTQFSVQESQRSCCRLVPGNCGELDLTVRKARSTARNLCVQVWSDSRPH